MLCTWDCCLQVGLNIKHKGLTVVYFKRHIRYHTCHTLSQMLLTPPIIQSKIELYLCKEPEHSLREAGPKTARQMNFSFQEQVFSKSEITDRLSDSKSEGRSSW